MEVVHNADRGAVFPPLRQCFVVLFYYTLIFKGRLARQPLFSSRFRNDKHFYVLSPYFSRYRYVWTEEIDSKMLRVHLIPRSLTAGLRTLGTRHAPLQSSSKRPFWIDAEPPFWLLRLF